MEQSEQSLIHYILNISRILPPFVALEECCLSQLKKYLMLCISGTHLNYCSDSVLLIMSY